MYPTHVSPMVPQAAAPQNGAGPSSTSRRSADQVPASEGIGRPHALTLTKPHDKLSHALPTHQSIVPTRCSARKEIGPSSDSQSSADRVQSLRR